MHYLLATWDGSGTVPVDFGIARRLTARGHTVTVLGDPTIAPEAEGSGAEFVSWRDAPHRRSWAIEDDVISDWEVVHNPVKLFRRLMDRLITGPAALYAKETADELERRAADVVLVDAALLGPLVATEALGVPTVGLWPAIYILPADGMPPFGLGLKPARGTPGRIRDRSINAVAQAAWRSGRQPLNDARAAYGLPPLDNPWDQLNSCHSVLVATARAFDFPAAVPEWAHYVGPVMDDPVWAAGDASLVDELFSAADADLPLVVLGVSGSYIKGQDDLVRRVAVALASLPVRGLVCTGPYVDPDTVPASDRVRVVRAAPHREVFPRADVVVTHGGHGTIIKALTLGKPVLCLPAIRDQKDNAVRMTERGAGLALKTSASPDRIAAAVRRLLDEPQFATAAAELGARIRAEIDDERLVELLERPARRQEPAERPFPAPGG
jgi:UDP:flavonoid glycosyltransferase YjiC (YdhE family)